MKIGLELSKKSFGILVELLKGRLVGKTLDQSRGFSSWIRFRKGRLCMKAWRNGVN